MKRMILVFAILPVMLFAQSSSEGPSPQSVTADLTFIIVSTMFFRSTEDVVYGYLRTKSFFERNESQTLSSKLIFPMN